MAASAHGPAVDLLVTVLQVLVVALCVVMKIPQISKIIRSGTSQGINLQSFLMECWCFSILVAYPAAKGYPVRAYLDLVALNIQNGIILYLILKDRNQLNLTVISAIVGYISILVGAANSWLPSFVLFAMSSSVPVLGAVGKILQLVSIVRTKDAGAISPLSWGIGSMSAGAKIFTTTVLTGDPYLIFLSTQASVLNGAVCISALIYKPKPKVP